MTRLWTVWMCAALPLSACVNDDRAEPALDASITSDAGTLLPANVSSPGAPDCYPAPTTYLELINACTDAERITKNPILPLLLTDGGLPPLP